MSSYVEWIYVSFSNSLIGIDAGWISLRCYDWHCSYLDDFLFRIICNIKARHSPLWLTVCQLHDFYLQAHSHLIWLCQVNIFFFLNKLMLLAIEIAINIMQACNKFKLSLPITSWCDEKITFRWYFCADILRPKVKALFDRFSYLGRQSNLYRRWIKNDNCWHSRADRRNSQSYSDVNEIIIENWPLLRTTNFICLIIRFRVHNSSIILSDQQYTFRFHWYWTDSHNL